MTDDDLVRVVREFRNGILGGRPSQHMCLAVCLPLEGFLSFAFGLEVRARRLQWSAPGVPANHMILLLPDGRVLDPTADQFDGMPDVYLGSMPEQYLEWQ